MATIWGILDIDDRDTTVDNVGQRAVYDAITELTNRHNEQMQQVTAAFVQEVTTDYQETYYLPGGGMMQDSTRLSRPGAVKPVGSYTAAYDLLDARDQLAWDDITMAYMTLNKLQAATQNIMIRHANWVRHHILRHLLNATNATFEDEVRGTLTIRRLANGDGTDYPPIIGSDAEAGETHYLESGYADTAISDTNNPYVTIKNELEEHFGAGNVVTWINNAETPETEAMTNFVPVTDQFIREGADTATVVGAPTGNLPGKLIGRIDDVWVMEWRYMPASYILGIDLMQPAPLKKRVDEPTSILGRGELALVAEQMEFPLTESFWRDRHGYGAANRLNGVVMELGTGGTYDTPAAYA